MTFADLCLSRGVFMLAILTINEILLDLYVPNSQNIAHALAVILPSVVTFLAYKFFSFK